ncbi:MAG: flagellar basal-body rod protein FlgF [Rhizobiales bacterium]|nr:flagellar basal-body rod protein FlgF [Hyphomicrobiales bacterium]
MQNALLVGLSRQVALSRELDVVANNIANINTTGYKADGALFEEYLSSAARSGQNQGRVSFVRDRGTWHDLSAGPIEKTGNPLNVAIDGNAFLVVQTARGERYTRNGALQINGTGELVTSEGDAVLGDAGPIVFQPTDNQVTFSKDGTISVREGTSKSDSARGSLRLVAFEGAQQLRKDGSSAFTTIGDAQPQPTKASRIIQGSIEKSNVRGVVEMSRMIEITRAYTQIAAMLKQQTDQDQQNLNKLAEVPN